MAGIYLEFISGTKRDGEVLRLPGRRFLLGRGEDCEVRIDSDFTSRKHALLSLEGEKWVIRDRDSQNGTHLNGKPITLAALTPLDEIELGTAGPVLRVVTMDPAPPISDEGESPPPVVEEIPLAMPLSETPTKQERPPAPIAPSMPQKRSERRRMPPILALLGLVFSASVAMGVWGVNFPYEPATAPILWCMAGLRYVAPNAIPDPGTQLWVFRGLLMVYGLIAGILLQRPIRRIVLLVAFAGFHILAALAL